MVANDAGTWPPILLSRLFPYSRNQYIHSLQKRFSHIVNHLAPLGKTFPNEDLINKVLRCLSREWQPKVTAIFESKDLSSMSLATLFGKLQEHEMELQQLNQYEETNRRKSTFYQKTMRVKRTSFKGTKIKMAIWFRFHSNDEDQTFQSQKRYYLIQLLN